MAIFNGGIFHTYIHSSLTALDAQLFVAGANGMIAYIGNDNNIYDVSPQGYSSKTIVDIDFTANKQKGFAVTSDGLVFHSVDYGRTWYSAATVSLTDVRVLKTSPLDYVFIGGYNSGNNNKIFRSTDHTSYSVVWSEADSDPIEDLTFDGSDHIYAIDLGETYVSNDSGATFFYYTSPTTFMDSIFCFDSDNVTIGREVSGDGIMLTTSALTTGTYVGFGTFTKATNAIWMTSQDYVHAAMDDGYIARISGTTIDYFTQILSTTNDCEDIAFKPDNQTGYVCVGTSIYKTSDNGDNWSLLTSAVTNTITSIKTYN